MSVTVELDEDPRAMLKLVGVAARVKSVTATETFTELDKEPPVAITVIM